jgi:hypothetical protein
MKPTPFTGGRFTMAEEFECCPICGDWTDIGGHYCGKCDERYVTEDDAHSFAEYLKKKYENILSLHEGRVPE